ncbi:MAG TPA: BA14K family protein [Xanthobacteraceae bacterium]|nr:BA14K family protein [Xanthobacteraceae bacterium]
MILRSRALALALVAAVPVCLAGSASAAPLSAPLGLQNGTDSAIQTVQWRDRGWGGRGFGPGFVAGAATGAIVGGALAGPGYYGYDYGPGYYSYGYDYGAPSYGADPDAIAYCQQRFRSFDPATGTYLGYDGQRHPCP